MSDESRTTGTTNLALQSPYGIVIACLIAYAALSLLAPEVSNARYHLSETKLLLLRLTIIIPVHLIWLLATQGAVSFKYYAGSIKNSREEPVLNLIANGLLWTLAYLITITMGSAILPYFVHASFYDTLIIIRDHLAPLFALIAFITLYRGSQSLKAVTHFNTWNKSTPRVVSGFALFAFFFVLEFSATPAGSLSAASRNVIAVLPHELLLITLVIPYIVSWFFGILALVNIATYARQVNGVLYRLALQNLVKGIGAVIFFMIVYQVITFAARYLAQISIGLTLVIVYALLVLYGIGFVFVRSGAKKLLRIESVQ